MEKEQKIKRMPLLDAMRGYFILWIGIFNTINVLNVIYPNLYYSGILLLINDKGWFCLSAIFGYSCGLLFKKEDKGAKIFFQRMLVLFALGLCNSFLYYGDILKDYAAIGMLLYAFRNVLIKHQKMVLLTTLICTIIAICTVDNDMVKVGKVSDFIQSQNVFLANFKYSIYLNIHAKYYLIVYHLEMFLLILIGFYTSFSGIKATYLWVFEKAASNFRLYLGLDILMLVLFILTGSNIIYFSHILFFALWYMTGFYLLIKPKTWLHNLLSSIGQKTLSIYVCQNVILCSFWMAFPILKEYGLIINSLIFLGLQIVILSIFVRSHDKMNIVEKFWRKVAGKL
ncbi:hypothetical protein VB796_23480 [Arcicella sp. LKC2W]|uniref:hypothetical protein n=1 Tax=Arcicella sp. LKC2W TaxID=2984198 RepID=UPI002B21709B|nr:hypothetical protein [Arcicella sp. LKC2W]MEA5462053.1 hypothetical protein [Arcicella sp. LKC2W]